MLSCIQSHLLLSLISLAYREFLSQWICLDVVSHPDLTMPSHPDPIWGSGPSSTPSMTLPSVTRMIHPSGAILSTLNWQLFSRVICLTFYLRTFDLEVLGIARGPFCRPSRCSTSEQMKRPYIQYDHWSIEVSCSLGTRATHNPPFENLFTRVAGTEFGCQAHVAAKVIIGSFSVVFRLSFCRGGGAGRGKC